MQLCGSSQFITIALISILAVLKVSTAIDLGTLINELSSGKLFQWIVQPRNCSPIVASKSLQIPDKVVATIDNWEYFYDPRFGPQKYLAVSNELLAYDENGDGEPYYRLVTVRVYENNTVGLSFEVISTLSAESWSQADFSSFLCPLTDAAVRFVPKRSLVVSQLNSFDEILDAVDNGLRVTYVTEYAKCYSDSSASMGAIGGSSIDPSYDLAGEYVKWKRRTLIKNYQGAGYVYDAVEVSASIHSPYMVNVTASDITTTDYSEEYIETFTCALNESIFFYSF